MPERALVSERDRRSADRRTLAAGLQWSAAVQFLRLPHSGGSAGGVCSAIGTGGTLIKLGPENGAGQMDYDGLVALLRDRTLEDGTFDFKAVISASGNGKAEHQYALRRAATSFANADGGWLIFGVTEEEGGANPESR